MGNRYSSLIDPAVRNLLKIKIQPTIISNHQKIFKVNFQIYQDDNNATKTTSAKTR